MNFFNTWARILLILLLLVAGLLPAATASANWAPTVITAESEKISLEAPLLREGRTLVPVRSLIEALGGRVEWDSASGAATILKGNNTIKLFNGSSEAVKNGQSVLMDVPPQLMENRLMVPLRFVAEALGSKINYSPISQNVTIISSGPEQPERVHNSSFPAKVAFNNNNALWLVDGSRDGSAPVQVTREGAVEIVGWSPDGQWLLYLHYESLDTYNAKPFLWVVKDDGTNALRVDPAPVSYGVPAWSPKENIIAYSTQGFGEIIAGGGSLKIARFENSEGGKIAVSELLPESSGVSYFAWAPDGQSIAVSLPRTQERPLLINRIYLNGGTANLLTLGEANLPGEYIYTRSATGIKWSPDGRYLAYYLEPSSASLAADGVSIQVLDLLQAGRTLDLGGGLRYSQWLAWSPDGTRLAFIGGYGRDVAMDKHLYLADMQSGGKIIDYGSSGQVDTHPVWAPTKNDLLFCRGNENNWMDNFQFDVLVPGQRIWYKAAGEEAQRLTTGSENTADYAPIVSVDGKNLFYLRLQRFDNGSLYYKPLSGGEEIELIRGLTGGHSYYGNYYPEWVSIY